MPMGKGTYGNQKGRPKKRENMMGGGMYGSKRKKMMGTGDALLRKHGIGRVLRKSAAFCRISIYNILHNSIPSPVGSLLSRTPKLSTQA